MLVWLAYSFPGIVPMKLSYQYLLSAATQDLSKALSPLLALATLTKLRCVLHRGYFPHVADKETEIRVIKQAPCHKSTAGQ